MVYLDGRYAFWLSSTLVEDRGLGVGQDLTGREIDELLSADQFHRALESALGYLTYRPRSEKEVIQKLGQKKYDPEVIDRVIERLRLLRYVDDVDFARFWIDNREAFSPRGARLLKMELRQRGVDSETIDTVMRGEVEIDEVASAIRLGRKKLRSYASADRATFRQRMGAYLQRRGFDFEAINQAVIQLWQELNPVENDDPNFAV